MTDSLLPPNATPAERAGEDAMAHAERAVDADAPAALWDPGRCPPALLPALAEALDLPGHWPEDDAGRRRAIRGAVPVHRVRGTLAALKWSLRDAGVAADVEERPGGAAFTVGIGVLNSAALEPDLATEAGVRALAERTGRASVTYQVSIAASASAVVPLAAAAGGAALASPLLEAEPLTAWDAAPIPLGLAAGAAGRGLTTAYCEARA